MRPRLSVTRVLQIGLLFLLVVSVAQVAWWYVDQKMYATETRHRLLEHFAKDVPAAQRMLSSGEREADVARLYPHLQIGGGRADIAQDALDELDAERRKRLNQYRWEGGFFIAVLLACMAVLWKTLREEAELRRRQQNFVAAVSHEFKSPLASLQLAAETMMLRALPPEKSKQLVQRMLEDLRRMGEMVAKILDASRLEQGRIELQPEPIRLARAVSAVMENFEPRAISADVRLESDIAEEIEVKADPVAMRAVLSNLIDNAVKATAAAGGGQVKIDAERTDGHVRLAVRDDGLGFRPEEAAKLFGRFYRPGDELRRRGPGSGLGLFIVERFMHLEHGRVHAHSDGPGRGAVFTVSWSIAREAGT